MHAGLKWHKKLKVCLYILLCLGLLSLGIFYVSRHCSFSCLNCRDLPVISCLGLMSRITTVKITIINVVQPQLHLNCDPINSNKTCHVCEHPEIRLIRKYVQE